MLHSQPLEADNNGEIPLRAVWPLHEGLDFGPDGGLWGLKQNSVARHNCLQRSELVPI
jgi:hypothetical protein